MVVGRHGCMLGSLTQWKAANLHPGGLLFVVVQQQGGSDVRHNANSARWYLSPGHAIGGAHGCLLEGGRDTALPSLFVKWPLR